MSAFASNSVLSLLIGASTNRITTSGFAYDAAGNLVQWPGGTVTMGAEYDVDGRLIVVKWDGVERERYYYDARNLRVAGGGSYQVYGLSGELLGEYRPVPNSTVPEMWLERVYFAGRLVATVEEDGEVDPVFWTVRISGLAAWRMERSHAENAKDVPAESEGEGGGRGDPGRTDGRRDRQGL